MKLRMVLFVLAVVACGKSTKVGPPIDWCDLDSALAGARTPEKPILLHFTDRSAPEEAAFRSLEVREELTGFTAVHIEVDPEKLGYFGYEWRWGIDHLPTTLVVGSFSHYERARDRSSPDELYRSGELPAANVFARGLRGARIRFHADRAHAADRHLRALARQPPPIRWYENDLELGQTNARTLRRPLLVYVWASYDTASKEMERTFADVDVRLVVSEVFEAVSLDITDDEQPVVEQWRKRLPVLGTPMIILYDANGMRLQQWSSFMTPDVLLKELDLAMVKLGE